MTREARGLALLAAPLLIFLGLPMLALLASSSPSELMAAFAHPSLIRASLLSLQTTTVSLLLIVMTGLPLAWWLARSQTLIARSVETFVELPIVVPPAVVGVALLMAYGREGVVGAIFAPAGIGISFTTVAVVFAQVMVAAPFFVQAATAGFRRVDDDLLLVAQTLGATPREAFLRVAIPAALPSLLAGAALSWARALGEFGATLLFAGNLVGETQTLPLAIFSALEADVGLARSLALVLGGAAFGILLLARIALGERARSEAR